MYLVQCQQIVDLENYDWLTLNEFSQGNKTTYKFQTTGIENESTKFFRCELFVGDAEAVIGEGNSKKRAEQEAARLFFEEKNDELI